MKRTLTHFLLITLVGLSAAAPAAEPARLVAVGTGVVSTPPDSAVFRAGVSVTERDASAALAAANRVVASIRKVLDDTGIDLANIRTVQFNVVPQYGPRKKNGQPATLSGYLVSHVLSISTTELANLGELLDHVVGAGANVIQNVNFTNSEPARFQEEARRLAVKDAKRQAEIMAKAAGQQLGDIVLIQPTGTTSGRPRPHPGARMMSVGVPVAAGENEYRASVTVEYSLR